MEFPFAINKVFKKELVKVNNLLVPTDSAGNNQTTTGSGSQIIEILNEMGVASGKAQDLKMPITSGEKLRNSDHVVYFLSDHSGNRGSVVGLLKVGFKKLYLFDVRGVRHEVQALCILDFYVHESKQRMGCGKILYEYMLKEEKVRPEHLAIDRPSDKLIHFLYKHYGLKTIIPQCNHYVVFEDFFSSKNDSVDGIAYEQAKVEKAPKILASFPPLDANGMEQESYNGLQRETFGRHAASKPICSMGKILNDPTAQSRSTTRRSSLSDVSSCGLEEGSNNNGTQGSNQLIEDEITKNQFLHSQLW